ncbi:MAG: hypothetical protein ACOX05_06080 [Bacillota bacterium]|jgi:hypothetical protein
MATNKEIHEFAMRWLETYRNSNTKEHEVEEGFEDECFALGLDMDGGKKFEAEFPDKNALNDYKALDKIIEQVQDINLLGSAIFSKWRYITHWSFDEQLLSTENREWFILAFGHLASLTSEDGANSFVFEGQVQKIKIVSNNIVYGSCPKPDEEVEQRLTINANGRVWFSGYNYSRGFGQYERGRTKNYSIGKEAATRILSAIDTYFSNEDDTVFITDIGIWEMTITNTEGKSYQFKGSLCCDFNVDGVDLSDLIRDTLGIPGLFVFDGNYKPDVVDKITINYHRVTQIKPSMSISDTAEDCDWDYSEQLVIDRETATLEHIQCIGAGGIITRKYYIQEDVVDLLNDLDADSLFDHIDGNGPDVITDPLETKDYKIIVDFKKRPQLIIKGTYDKNGLPSDFPKFAEDLLDFMLFYGMGEILDPLVYMKAKRKTSDYIFCSVEFSEGGKSYYYTTKDDTLKVGDDVFVPVGNDGHTAIAEIVNIECFPEDKVPFPLDKVKSIIRRCTDDELNPPILQDEPSDKAEIFCPLYEGSISQYDCDEISRGVKHGCMSNDGLSKLMDIELIKKKREVCLACKRAKKAVGKLTYSDNWIRQGYSCGQRFQVSDIVDYRIWSNKTGAIIGVTVDFETANDFHYDLLATDWNRFLSEVLCIDDMLTVTKAFQSFFRTKTNLFAFEEALNEHGINYKKTAFY